MTAKPKTGFYLIMVTDSFGNEIQQEIEKKE
jgi:hypothetical protein